MTAHPFTILIDGGCPVCRHESRMMKRLDRGRGRLRIVDIASPGFDPGAYDRSMDQLMGEIHGVTADGSLVTGMDVFRRAYRAVGLGWLLAPTGWPMLRPVFDGLYRVFARNRVRWFGGGCADGACRVEPATRP